LWDYYIEELRYRPSYDMEMAGLELQQEQEVDSLSDQPILRLAKHTLTHGMEYDLSSKDNLKVIFCRL
jgi:hypothetical protein